MYKNLLVVGGDERAARMVPLLQKAGYHVSTMGIQPDDEKLADIWQAHAALFPYPYSVKNGCIPTLTGLTLHPEDVLKALKPGTAIIAGSGIEKDVQNANEHHNGFTFATYMQSDAFLQLNAEISAEAAVMEAMRKTPQALHGMTVLITGYGRFGRALAKRLHALGATVWVAARKEQQRLRAASDGMRSIALDEIKTIAPNVRMVLNTVPSPVISNETLNAFAPQTWLLELASVPYGFDRERARACGLLCEVLPALPARYAPQTAAEALCNTVIRLLSEVIG